MQFHDRDDEADVPRGETRARLAFDEAVRAAIADRLDRVGLPGGLPAEPHLLALEVRFGVPPDVHVRPAPHDLAELARRALEDLGVEPVDELPPDGRAVLELHVVVEVAADRAPRVRLRRPG